MKLNFRELFPLLQHDNIDEFEGHCKFYFEGNLLQECLDYVKNTYNVMYAQNDFAKNACSPSPSVECCKQYAKDNDIAYDICIQSIPTSSSSFSIVYIVLFVIIIIIIITMIKLFLYQ